MTRGLGSSPDGPDAEVLRHARPLRRHPFGGTPSRASAASTGQPRATLFEPQHLRPLRPAAAAFVNNLPELGHRPPQEPPGAEAAAHIWPPHAPTTPARVAGTSAGTPRRQPVRAGPDQHE